MAVNHVGVEIQGLADRQHRGAEKGEALQVVEVIPLGGAVKLAALVKLVPGHKIEGIVRRGGGHEVKGQVEGVGQRRFQILSHRRGGNLSLLDGPVIGHQDLDLHPLLHEGLGQGAHHVRQPAGLGKGHPFGGHEQHS